MAYNNRSPPNGYKGGHIPGGGGKPPGRMPSLLMQFPTRDLRGMGAPPFQPRDRGGITHAYHRFLPPLITQRERGLYMAGFPRDRALPPPFPRDRALPPHPFPMERLGLPPQHYPRDRHDRGPTPPGPRDRAATPNYLKDRPTSHRDKMLEVRSRSRSRSPSLSPLPRTKSTIANHRDHSQEETDNQKVPAEEVAVSVVTETSDHGNRETVASSSNKDRDSEGIKKRDKSPEAEVKPTKTSPPLTAPTHSEDLVTTSSSSSITSSQGKTMAVPQVLPTESTAPTSTQHAQSVSATTAASGVSAGASVSVASTTSQDSKTDSKEERIASPHKSNSATGYQPGQNIESVIQRLTANINMNQGNRVDPGVASSFLPLKKRIMSNFASGSDAASPISSKLPVPSLALGTHGAILQVYGNKSSSATATGSTKEKVVETTTVPSKRKLTLPNRVHAEVVEKKAKSMKSIRENRHKTRVSSTRKTRSQTKSESPAKSATKADHTDDDGSKGADLRLDVGDSVPCQEEKAKSPESSKKESHRSRSSSHRRGTSSRKHREEQKDSKRTKESKDHRSSKDRHHKNSSSASGKDRNRLSSKDKGDSSTKLQKETSTKDKPRPLQEHKDEQSKGKSLPVSTEVKPAHDQKDKRSKKSSEGSSKPSTRDKHSRDSKKSLKEKGEKRDSKVTDKKKPAEQTKETGSAAKSDGQEVPEEDKQARQRAEPVSPKIDGAPCSKDTTVTAEPLQATEKPSTTEKKVARKDKGKGGRRPRTKDVEKRQAEKATNKQDKASKSKDSNKASKQELAIQPVSTQSQMVVMTSTSITVNRIRCSGLPTSIANQLGLGTAASMLSIKDSDTSKSIVPVHGKTPRLTTTIPVPDPLINIPYPLPLDRLAGPLEGTPGSGQLVPVRRSTRQRKPPLRLQGNDTVLATGTRLKALPPPPPPPPTLVPELEGVTPSQPSILVSADSSVPNASSKTEASLSAAVGTATSTESSVTSEQASVTVTSASMATDTVSTCSTGVTTSVATPAKPKRNTAKRRGRKVGATENKAGAECKVVDSLQLDAPTDAAAKITVLPDSPARDDPASDMTGNQLDTDSPKMASGKEGDSPKTGSGSSVMKEVKIDICPLPHRCLHGDDHASASHVEKLDCHLSPPPPAATSPSNSVKGHKFTSPQNQVWLIYMMQAHVTTVVNV